MISNVNKSFARARCGSFRRVICLFWSYETKNMNYIGVLVLTNIRLFLHKTVGAQMTPAIGNYCSSALSGTPITFQKVSSLERRQWQH